MGYDESSSSEPASLQSSKPFSPVNFITGQPPTGQEDSVDVDSDLNYDWDCGNHTLLTTSDFRIEMTDSDGTSLDSAPSVSSDSAELFLGNSPISLSNSYNTSDVSQPHDSNSDSSSQTSRAPAPIAQLPLSAPSHMALPPVHVLRCITCSRTFASGESLR